MSLFKTIILLVAITFATNYIYADSGKLLQLQKSLKTAPNDTTKAELYSTIAFELLQNNPVEALKYIEDGILLSKELNYTKGEADCYRIKGIIYGEFRDYANSLEYFFEALDLYSSIGNRIDLAKTYANIGLLYMGKLEFELATKYTNIAYRINDSIGGLDGANGKAKCLTSLGIIEVNKRNPQKAIDYYLKALILIEKLNNKSGLSIILNNLAVAYGNLKQFDKAYEYNQKSLTLSQELNSKTGIIYALANYGEWELYQSKEKIQNKSISIFHANQSIHYNKEALILLDSIENLSLISTIYNFLSDAYQLKGQYDSALHYSRLYSIINDSLFSIEKEKEFRNLGSVRELKLKESKIQLLESEKTISLYRNLFIALVLLIALIIILFVNYKLRRKNKLSEVMITKLTEAVEQSDNHIMITNIDGTIEYVNNRFSVVTGYKKEEIIGKKPNILKSGISSDKDYKKLWDTILSGSTYNSEIINKRKNGDFYWEKNIISPIKDRKGTITHFLAVKEDISHTKKIEEDLRRTNKRLKDILDAASEIAIIATDTNGVITSFNSGASKMLGYTETEVINQATPIKWHLKEEIENESKLLSSEFGYEVSGFRVFVEKADLTGSNLKEWTYISKSGSRMTVNLMITTVTDEKGIINGYLGIAQDITQQKKAEVLLIESEERFRTIVENSVDGMILVDEKGKIAEWNRAQEVITGYSRNEVIGKHLFEITEKVTTDTRKSDALSNKFKIVLDDTLSTGYSPYLGKAIEAPIKTKSGEILLLEQKLFSIKTSKGYRIGAINRDMTDIRLAENALKESEEHYRTLFESANDGIFLLQEGVVVRCNPKTSSLFGAEIEQIIGKPPASLSPSQQPNGTLSIQQAEIYINRALNGENLKFEWVHRRIDGTLFDAEITLNAISIKDKVYIQAIIRDITDRKNAEKAIKELNESLEQKVVERTKELNIAMKIIEQSNVELTQLNENIATEAQKLLLLNEKLSDSEQALKLANSTKDKFISIIAHDLKNPIAGVRSLLDMMLNYFTEIEKVELHKMIRTSFNAADNTYELLEQLLTWAKSTKGEISFEPKEQDLLKTIEYSISQVDSSAFSKEISISHNLQSSLLAWYDNNYINTVLRNLLSNAIKFSYQSSEIKIIVRNEPMSNFIEISVKDSGVGIESERLDELFKLEFVKTTVGTAKEKGTGLGLILCREFVEKHQGVINVKSIPNQGSTFSFTIPKKMLPMD